MNRKFNASSKQSRSILAVFAVVATVFVIGSIDGLSQHYGSEAQLVSTTPVTVAKR